MGWLLIIGRSIWEAINEMGPDGARKFVEASER